MSSSAARLLAVLPQGLTSGSWQLSSVTGIPEIHGEVFPFPTVTWDHFWLLTLLGPGKDPISFTSINYGTDLHNYFCVELALKFGSCLSSIFYDN